MPFTGYQFLSDMDTWHMQGMHGRDETGCILARGSDGRGPPLRLQKKAGEIKVVQFMANERETIVISTFNFY